MASTLVQLGAVAQPQAWLDGFKSRALKAAVLAQRHLYVAEWCKPQLSEGERQAEGATPHAAVIVLSGALPMPGVSTCFAALAARSQSAIDSSGASFLR